ncbi:DUF6745 domain-containing protein [Amycolatopsis sp. NPDC004368]
MHAADGPAIAYPDGWRAYAWHGTPVPAWVIEDVTADAVDANRISLADLLDRSGLEVLERLERQSPSPGSTACKPRATSS